MPVLFHQLLTLTATQFPENTALFYKDERYSYQELATQSEGLAVFLAEQLLRPGERCGVWLPKLPQTVASYFAISLAGGMFVPLNPLLKPHQVGYICGDCEMSLLITQRSRWKQLLKNLSPEQLPPKVLLIDATPQEVSSLQSQHTMVYCWPAAETPPAASDFAGENRLSSEMAAILYTSGSTGQPKGVVLSHQNLIYGAKSVAQYLGNTASDRLLAVLPFSFDYGLSQLTTACLCGASLVLMEYLLPQDILRAVTRYQITGLAAVPPLWHQIVDLPWPAGATDSIRYFTNSGGHMPRELLERLRRLFKNASPYLMYGLTEAFRSSYLPPDQIDRRPESIGKAIPNVDLLVLNEAGEICSPGEVGELVHRGPLVAMGYWNAPDKTRQRFRPLPAPVAGLREEIAVFSGDYVKTDDQGYLYFVGRKDEMIKSSGYRVSPGEIESALISLEPVKEVAALGIAHPTLGQAIVVVCASNNKPEETQQFLFDWCKRHLPGYMQPLHIAILSDLPRNNNGKIDRSRLKQDFADLFQASA